MNTNMTGFRGFSKIFAFLFVGRNSLSIGRVKEFGCIQYGRQVLYIYELFNVEREVYEVNS